MDETSLTAESLAAREGMGGSDGVCEDCVSLKGSLASRSLGWAGLGELADDVLWLSLRRVSIDSSVTSFELDKT